jgi:hemerythrin
VATPVPIDWNDSFAIGVPVIDAQHRELFARVASFEAALERGDAQAIARTFGFLREYALVHFAQEERLIHEARYPREDEHKEKHAQFVERLAALVREHETSGATAFLGLRTRNWITVWLLDHVAGDDQAVGRFIRSRAA